VNLWVYLLWYYISRPQRGGQLVYTKLFPLRTMLDFLAEAVKQRFPLKKAIYLPALE
jgi:hypothetical protein